MKVRGFWSRLRDWRSLRGSSPCQGNPLMVLMIWSCKSLGAGEGCSDREKTKLEQRARHLRVPGTVGTVLRPVEPKHAAGGSLNAAATPSCTKKGASAGSSSPPQGGSALPGGRGLRPLPAEQSLQHGISDRWKRPHV